MSVGDWLLMWGRRHFGTLENKKVEGLIVVNQMGGDGQRPVTAYLTSRDSDELLSEVQQAKSRDFS